jgi:eukaryotic-like serine/threonine-protein kinase
LGRFSESEAELARLLAAQQSVLPGSHRDVLNTRHTLACARAWLGSPLLCVEELLKVLQDREQVIGAEPGSAHIEIVAARDHLVWALGRAGRLNDARAMCDALLEEVTTGLGSTHPQTLHCRYRAAWLAELAGR